MINQIVAITLVKSYDPTPVDNTDFVDLSNWSVVLGSLVSQDAVDLVVDSAGIRARLRSPVFAPAIDNTYGDNFRITFTVEVTTADPVTVNLSFLKAGAFVPFFGIYAPDLVAGTNVVQIDVNALGYSFDQVQLNFFCPTYPNTYDLHDVDIVGLDASFTGLDNGDRVIVSWDTVANDFLVQREDNPGAVLTTIVSGPNLGPIDLRGQTDGLFIPRDPIPGERNNIIFSNYTFCDGFDLVKFIFDSLGPVFPYATKYIVPNDSSCVINDPGDPGGGGGGTPPIVCDIKFNARPVITNASALFVGDGQVQLSAVSVHGTVKYSRYPTGNSSGLFTNATNTDGLFTNLLPGIYRFYAVDQYNCNASIDVVVEVAESLAYGAKYRLQYYDKLSQVQSIAIIEERGYNGATIDVKGTGSPVSIIKPSSELNNKFDVLRPTSAEFNITSEKHYQFIGLFSQDDKKYRLHYTHDTVSWYGFLTPSAYSERFSPSDKYPIALKFTDNLARLSTQDFLDESKNRITIDMKLIDLIALILKKTDLLLDIVSGVNKFSEGMTTTAADDPLAQSYIECLCFYDDDGNPLKCSEVLERVLKPFGAFIIQNNGAWHIIETDGQTSPYTYRRFNYNGVYQSNGTIDPLLAITAPQTDFTTVLFSGGDHLLDIAPAFGKISITFALQPRASIFPTSLDLWQANLYLAVGAIATPTPVPGKLYKGLTISKLESIQSNKQSLIEVLSPAFDVISSSDAVALSFKYRYLLFSDAARGQNGKTPLWVRLIWKLRLSVGAETFYYSAQIGWNQETSFTENAIYITDFNGDYKNFDTNIILPTINPSALISLQMTARVVGALYGDFLNLAGLHAIATVNLPIGTKVKGYISHADWDFVVGTGLFWYVLEQGTDAESSHAGSLPEVVRPTDHAGGTNEVVWKIDMSPTTGRGGVYRAIETVEISDVFVKFLPNKAEPITQDVTEFVNNASYKEDLPYTLNVGDFPTSLINKQLYTNILKLSDGTPTKNWTRKAIPELLPLQGILLRSMGNQYNKPSWRLSGTWVGPDIEFISILKHTVLAIDFSIAASDTFHVPTWQQSGSGQAWILGSSPASVSFSDVAAGDSTFVKQPGELITGSRIRIQFHLTRLASLLTRVDRFVFVVFNGGDVVQEVILADGITTDTEFNRSAVFSIDADGDEFGFYIKNVNGDGACMYELEFIRGSGVTSIRYYGSNSITRMDRDNQYEAELLQLTPAVQDTDPDIDDTGGGNTGGTGGTGGVTGRGYSSGFGSGFK